MQTLMQFLQTWKSISNFKESLNFITYYWWCSEKHKDEIAFTICLTTVKLLKCINCPIWYFRDFRDSCKLFFVNTIHNIKQKRFHWNFYPFVKFVVLNNIWIHVLANTKLHFSEQELLMYHYIYICVCGCNMQNSKMYIPDDEAGSTHIYLRVYSWSVNPYL